MIVFLLLEKKKETETICETGKFFAKKNQTPQIRTNSRKENFKLFFSYEIKQIFSIIQNTDFKKSSQIAMHQHTEFVMRNTQ